MHFSISLLKPPMDVPRLKLKIHHQAILSILSYPYKSTERSLNKELKNIYDLTLEDLCLLIVHNIKIEQVTPTEFTIIISNRKLDQIARFITYGNGMLIGSNILLKAFDWKGVY